MHASFWDEKYSDEDYFFGTRPHPFFAQELKKLKPGKILLPADGEGRHGVFAARLGWDVTIMDYSEKGREKALQLADQHNVHIRYDLVDLFKAELPADQYDAVGMIYAHFLTEYQEDIHRKLWKALQQDGHLILVGFGKEQLQYNSGGPPEKGMLYDPDTLIDQFDGAKIVKSFRGVKEIDEGVRLRGKADQVYLHLVKS